MTIAAVAIGGTAALAVLVAATAVRIVREADDMHDINFDDEEQQP